MIKKVQILWYLNKDDLENYCIDFKEYKSHKLEGYEICDVDEDLIFDLCDWDPDRLEPIGYFKNIKEKVIVIGMEHFKGIKQPIHLVIMA